MEAPHGRYFVDAQCVDCHWQSTKHYATMLRYPRVDGGVFLCRACATARGLTFRPVSEFGGMPLIAEQCDRCGINANKKARKVRYYVQEALFLCDRCAVATGLKKRGVSNGQE
jgi:hypothetical protein